MCAVAAWARSAVDIPSCLSCSLLHSLFARCNAHSDSYRTMPYRPPAALQRPPRRTCPTRILPLRRSRPRPRRPRRLRVISCLRARRSKRALELDARRLVHRLRAAMHAAIAAGDRKRGWDPSLPLAFVSLSYLVEARMQQPVYVCASNHSHKRRSLPPSPKGPVSPRQVLQHAWCAAK